MKTTLYYFSLVSVLSLFACGSEQKTNERAEQATVPDSLKNERLIAAYYDDGTNCSVVLRYDNNSKSSGKKITMCENAQSSYHQIIPSGDNKFFCEENNTEYEVLENKVISTVGGIISRNVSIANLPDIIEYKRIDIK